MVSKQRVSSKKATVADYQVTAEDAHLSVDSAQSSVPSPPGTLVTAQFKTQVRNKELIIWALAVALLGSCLASLNSGAIAIPFTDTLKILIHHETTGAGRIIWNIRLPRVIAAILVGAGLSISGVGMQSILKNPLASPYTLGLSNASAFGASCAIVFFNSGTQTTSSVIITNPYMVSISAFVFAMLASLIILALARLTRISPESMVLAGIAIGALFSAGLTFMQYLADSIQLAAIVSWSFGDLGRANWNVNIILFFSIVPVFIFFLVNRWNFNALDAGEEIAKSLGVQTELLRILTMLASSFLAALIVSAFGIIAFVGLLGPHISRRITGSDHRFLLITAPLTGAILLVIADMLSRMLLAPMILPVGIITSLLGAPLFIYLLLRRRNQWRM